MAYREPPQPVRPFEIQLIVRTFIPFESYFGFVGDDRTFSTSPFVTYRTGMFLVVDLPNGKITSPLIGNSTGTRLSKSDVPYITNVKTRLIRFEGDNGRVVLQAHMEAHDPFPVLEKAAPNIDTDLFFTAFLRDGNLFVAGSVVGDAFPNTEVFIRGHDDQAHPLLSFATPYDLTGTAHLAGVATRNLGRFEEGILLDQTGRLIGCVPWNS